MAADGKSISNSISKPDLKGALAALKQKGTIQNGVVPKKDKEQDVAATKTTAGEEYKQMLAASTNNVDGAESTLLGNSTQQTKVEESIPMVQPESSEHVSEQIVSSFDKILNSYNAGDNLAALTEMRNVARENGLVSLGDEIEQQIQDFKSSSEATPEQSGINSEQSLVQADTQKPKDSSQDPVLSGSIAQANPQSNPFSLGSRKSSDSAISQMNSETSSVASSLSSDVGSGMSFG